MHCILYTIHYTLYIIHYTLYTIHYSLFRWIEEVIVWVFLYMQFADASVEDLTQLVDIFLLLSGDEDAVVAHLCHPRLTQFVKGNILFGSRGEVVGILIRPMVVVNLVKDDHRRLVSALQILQRLVDDLNLLLEIGV